MHGFLGWDILVSYEKYHLYCFFAPPRTLRRNVCLRKERGHHCAAGNTWRRWLLPSDVTTTSKRRPRDWRRKKRPKHIPNTWGNLSTALMDEWHACNADPVCECISPRQTWDLMS